jgi:hypothetical protein
VKPSAIPTGWRKVRAGSRVRVGDRMFSSFTRRWYRFGRVDVNASTEPVGTCETFIRKVATKGCK